MQQPDGITATIRNMWGETEDAEFDWIESGPLGAVAVRVPGLGHCLIGKREDGGWGAVLVQPPRSEGAEPNVLDRQLIEDPINNTLEVELLPNSSGGDRIVVIVGGFLRA